jgi:hypothetical protein
MVRRSLLAGLVCALAGTVGEARADDLTKEQCVEANESAQSLRQDGKLPAARAQLIICLAKTCPGPVRDDCAERMTELERAAPTIVFAAKGSNGQALRAVQITMDGARLADHLDGSALAVDPGEHVFALIADGYEGLSKKLLVLEGVKGRKEVMNLALTTPTETPATPVLALPSDQRPWPGRDQRTLAYVLGGVGIVGIGVGTFFGLYAKSTYDDAASNSSSCAPGISFCRSEDVDRAKSAHTQATISTIAFIAGGALLTGGIVLFVIAPKDGGVTMRPSVGATSATLRMEASW